MGRAWVLESDQLASISALQVGSRGRGTLFCNCWSLASPSVKCGMSVKEGSSLLPITPTLAGFQNPRKGYEVALGIVLGMCERAGFGGFSESNCT